MRCILLLILAIAGGGVRAADPPPAGSPDDPVLGSWVGTETFAGESKPIALRFELYAKKNDALVVYYDNPRMKFANLGPMPVSRDGSVYDNAYFHLTLDAGHAALSGRKSFDGHDLAVELKRGSLPPQPGPRAESSRIATPTWTFGTGGPIWSSPVAAGGKVYFGSSDKKVYALDAKTGTPVWRIVTGGAVMGRPTIAGANLYVPSDDGALYKLDLASGGIVWKFDLHGDATRDLPSATSATYDYLTSAATVAGGIVYIGSSDRNVYAIDAVSARQIWRFETQGSVRSTPAVAAGRVYFGSYDHCVYALDAKTGALAWKHDTLEPVVSSALVDGGSVYIGSRSSDLFALDADTGSPRWKFFYWSSWVESSPTLRDGTLYIGSSDYQQVFAIDAASGAERWRFGSGGSPWSTPAVTARRVFTGVVGASGYFIDHRGGFFALDRADGKPVWRYPMPVVEGSMTSGVATSPVVAGRFVYFGGLDGTLYAFAAD